MKNEVEEAIEAIRLQAMWMAGRAHELTQDERMKEAILWGGNREERGERLLRHISIITGIDKVTNELKEELVSARGCTYAQRFLKRVELGDGRSALLNLVLRIQDEDDYD
ncbi:hypothetical protein KAW18_15615 [candidate division WOR-3 bacterium]|nr:hypothetical protein [candidate division WOR-3 bacterium]